VSNNKFKVDDLVWFYPTISSRTKSSSEDFANECLIYMPRKLLGIVMEPSYFNHEDVLDLKLLNEDGSFFGFAKAHYKQCELVEEK
jgi:hypothetical protein